MEGRRMKALVENYNEAVKLAEEMDKTLNTHDFVVSKRSRVVAVKHTDGSYLEFHSACFRKLSKKFMVVFTEHHGSHVYHRDDIQHIKEWAKPKYNYYNNYITE